MRSAFSEGVAENGALMRLFSTCLFVSYDVDFRLDLQGEGKGVCSGSMDEMKFVFQKCVLSALAFHQILKGTQYS